MKRMVGVGKNGWRERWNLLVVGESNYEDILENDDKYNHEGKK